jgi:predicted acylesterase/phospholipase RssA
MNAVKASLAISVALALIATTARAQGISQQQTKSSVNVASSTDVENYSRARKRVPWEAATDTTTIPFVLSASGGISLGSYQAGVTWALGRLTRYLADSIAARRRLHLGKPELWAATGASAGNINAVLSALEWCAAEPRLPEQSLFWRVWVNVGWPELFPHDKNKNKNRGTDFGVFDRSFFKNTLFRDIQGRMDSTRVRPEGCDGFAIGVTATRLDPSHFPVTDQLTAVTQRYAATFQLTQQGNSHLAFRQADSALRQRSLGEMLALDVGQSNLLTRDTLFTLIEASSSFPIAFSPRKLKYYPAAALDSAGRCPSDGRGRCLPAMEAYFTDGGVFDNNPLQLAFDIYERRAPSLDFKLPDGTVVATVPKTPPRALYVGADDYRGPLSDSSARMIDRGPVGGVDAVRRLILGAIPAAREYEMQTLARSIADGQRVPQEYIRVTTRYFPVFGEHVMAFGAFLGRPMREWDFYAGVYDGMVFAARDVICKKRLGFDPIELGDEDRCAKEFSRQLISGSLMPLGDIGPTVLKDMWAKEFNEPALRDAPGFKPAGATATDYARLQGLRWLTQLQIQHLDARGKPRSCRQIDWADKFLCNRNLDALLNSIRTNDSVWTQYQQWSQKNPCREQDTTSLDNPCLADQSFVALVKDPAFEFKDRIGEVLHRMWEVEDNFQKLKRSLPKEDQRPRAGVTPKFAPPHDGLVEFAEMTLRSIDWPARQGRDLDPSSIPPRAHGRLKFFTSMLPYQASVGASGRGHVLGGGGTSYSGFDVGWQPTFHLSDRVMIQAPTSLTRWSGLREASDSTVTTYLRTGLGVAQKLGGFKLQSVGVAVRPTISSIWFKGRGFGWWPRPEFERMIGYEMSFQLLAGKAKLTAYYTGSGLEKFDGTAGRSGLMVGLTDIPGIAYWLIR